MDIKSTTINICLGVLGNFESTEIFLQQELKFSRSFIKKFKFSKKFLKKSIHKGQTIELPLDFLNKNQINPRYHGPEIKIIHECENFLVLSKPDNIHCFPFYYSEQNNVLSFIRERADSSRLLTVNGGEYERGLLYRLDKCTSGLLVYLKNENTYFQLRQEFDQLVKTKKYYAVVEGQCSLMGNYSVALSAQGRKGGTMAQAKESEAGQIAELSIISCLYNKDRNMTLVELDLQTGVRHQIRCQLSLLGFPILGDTLYGARENQRVFLHAFQYSWHWQERSYSFKSELPSVFRELFHRYSAL